MMMMSFICSCRNKNQPIAISPKCTSSLPTIRGCLEGLDLMIWKSRYIYTENVDLFCKQYNLWTCCRCMRERPYMREIHGWTNLCWMTDTSPLPHWCAPTKYSTKYLNWQNSTRKGFEAPGIRMWVWRGKWRGKPCKGGTTEGDGDMDGQVKGSGDMTREKREEGVGNVSYVGWAPLI